MLQFAAKKVDICKVSKILIKANVEATITNDIITIEGNISENLLKEILNSVDVHIVRNYSDESNGTSTILSSSKETVEVASDSACKVDEIIKNSFEDDRELFLLEEGLDLRYSDVKRGEVYICRFEKKSTVSEQSWTRPVVIIQNDIGNNNSSTTIVLMLTSKPKKDLPVHHYFNFDDFNVKEFNTSRLAKMPFRNCALGEQIRTVDKKRLRKYLGTMSDEFMENIDDILKISLNLKDKKIELKDIESQNDSIKDINLNQIRTLINVDIDKLFEIKESDENIELKVTKILETFGFDMNKDGMDLVANAITVSLNEENYTLDSICEILSNHDTRSKVKIHYLIVSIVKERFNFKKFPTTDFIRLVNSFLIK